MFSVTRRMKTLWVMLLLGKSIMLLNNPSIFCVGRLSTAHDIMNKKTFRPDWLIFSTEAFPVFPIAVISLGRLLPKTYHL
jgi:hypothetical protein